ncbi:hypothetical protein TNCV_150391 [Trichonephila clavipes]|nr:hypothetical protein TNCV_150391 [Trichonephila clavipes]
MTIEENKLLANRRTTVSSDVLSAVCLCSGPSCDLYCFGLPKKNVLYIEYVKEVHSSQFTLGNSTPSLGELAGSKSTVWLLIRNLLGSKSTLIRGLPGIADSQVYRSERPLIGFSQVKICLRYSIARTL